MERVLCHYSTVERVLSVCELVSSARELCGECPARMPNW